jgi:hypothetical protein
MQADLDKIIGQRLGREKAKYADFDTYKASHERLQQIEDANKTELERLRERAEKAEAQAAELQTKAQVDAWKKEVSEATGVPEAALFGATKEELEAKGEELKPYFAASTTPVALGQGAKPAAPPARDPLRELIEKRR